MSSCEEFLYLFGLCQLARRCTGEDCPDVSQQAMEQARLVDEAKKMLPST